MDVDKTDGTAVATAEGLGGAPQGTVLNVAIVGSGAGGMYCATRLLERLPQVHVDVYEQRPVPFGLLRHGVAPDHRKPETIVAEFEELFADPRLRLIAGVTVCADITRAEMAAHYDAVIWAIGARTAHHLRVPGEGLDGVYTADDFFGWYTGLPSAPRIHLDGVREAVVIGLGDVGLDIARVLLKPAGAFADTQMPTEVIEELAAHRVPRVTIMDIAPAHRIRVKTKVLQEVLDLDRLAIDIDPADIAELPEDADQRCQDNMAAFGAAAGRQADEPHAHLRIVFQHRPVEIVGTHGVTGVVGVTEAAAPGAPEAELDAARVLPPDGEHAEPPELIAKPVVRNNFPAQLVVTAIGDDVAHLEGLPWDANRRIVPSQDTRLLDDGRVQAREYVSGWARRGNVAGFRFTRMDADAVLEALLADLGHGLLRAPDPGPDKVLEMLAQRGVEPIGWQDWHRLELAEDARGARQGRPIARIIDAAEQDAVLHPGH